MQHPAEVDEVTIDGPDGEVDSRQIDANGETSTMLTGLRMDPAPHLLLPVGLSISLAALWLLILSLASIILIPLMYSDFDERYPLRLDYHNLYGYGIWLAFLLVGCGTLSIRTACGRSAKSFIRFYAIAWLAGLACLGVVVARVVYYAKANYSDLSTNGLPHNITQFRVQIACDAMTVASLLFVSFAIVFYHSTAVIYWSPVVTNQSPNSDSDQVTIVNRSINQL